MMSLSGNLEHLPIVDIMQLLHQSRKSGILRVKGRKGESQLVFKDGGMVCANHLNNSIRIGKILVDLKIINQEILDKALQVQGSAGAGRKPLIITLIEQGLVNEKDAYKGLVHLIEMAIVEILTWKKGSFSLEVNPASNKDFRFYPGKLIREINVDTQSVLMDALRIFDEKRRDGELADTEPPEDEAFAEKTGAAIGIESDLFRPTGKVSKQKSLPEERLVCCPKCYNTFHADKHIAVLSPDTMNVCPACRYATFGTEISAVCPRCGIRNATPQGIRYTGWGCSALGAAFLCYGLYGLAMYFGNDWQTILSEGRPEPVSKIGVFFRQGFFPLLFTLFSGVFLAAVGRFRRLQDGARKDLETKAWAGVALCAVFEITKFVSWVKILRSFSFSYCAIGLASTILMTIFWCLPFLLLLWYLRSDAIAREFPE